MNAIIVTKAGYPTLSNIVEQMDEPVKILRSQGSADRLIRWGCSTPARASEVFNARLPRDKAAARKKMIDADVPMPRTVSDPPCIARLANHTRGRGLFVCNNRRELEEALRKGAAYVTQIYNKRSEYRVHVAHGAILFVSKKEAVTLNAKSQIVWNHHNGNFVFRTVAPSYWRRSVCLAALDAVEALQLDFGAVDVMADAPNDVTAVVTEVNTAPALSDYGLDKYAEYFDWLLRTGITRHNEIDRESHPSRWNIVYAYAKMVQ